jgi:membrane protease YdiL (CAAX protease family)
LARVLTEKTWKPEMLLHLLMAFFLCLGLGGLISGILLALLDVDAAEKQYYSMVLSTLTLHGGWLVTVALLLWWHKMSWADIFGFDASPRLQAIAQGVLTALAFLPAAWFLGQASAVLMKSVGFEPVVQTPVKILQESVSVAQQVYFGFMAVILAPCAEEILFRGVFYPAVKQAGFPRAALWGTSLAFALIHNNVMTFIPLTVLALVLVWLYEKTGNLLSCIAAHATFNLVNFVLLLNQSAIDEWFNKPQAAFIW